MKYKQLYRMIQHCVYENISITPKSFKDINHLNVLTIFKKKLSLERYSDIVPLPGN